MNRWYNEFGYYKGDLQQMNIKNINNSNSLQNALDISGIVNTKNKTIMGDKFYVGEGILRCDNYFISLDSVCMVEMGRRQNSVARYIFMIAIGILLSMFFYPIAVLKITFGIYGLTLGVSLVILGILAICFVYKSNEKIPYSLSIHLSDNSTYSYHSMDKDFLLDVMNVIQSCINDRKGGYNILMNQGKIERNDSSINIGNMDSFSGNIIGAGGSNTISGNGDNIVNKPIKGKNTGITAEEWMNLEKYFIMRQNEFAKSDIYYKICGNLATYSQRKDASNIKKYLQTIGKEAVKIIFSVGTNVAAMQIVKPIINKILSLKE